MKQTLRLFCLLIFMSSCVFKTGPNDNIDFGKVENIYDLEGVYRNLGETDSVGNPKYLSAIIWPDIKNNASIETVEVVAVDDNTLLVKAREKEKIIKEEHFIKGKNFKISSGRVLLKRSAILSLAYPADNPFIGPAYEEISIGLDKQGQGKYRSSSFFAGTAYLVIPLVGGMIDDIKFVKIE